MHVHAYDGADRRLTVTKDGIFTEEYRYNAAGFRVYEKSTRRSMERTPAYDAEGRLLPAVDNVCDKDSYLKEKQTLLQKNCLKSCRKFGFFIPH
ncbi:MAG: hypothetical protein R2941_05530 [Desulfobacterales bacterium]